MKDRGMVKRAKFAFSFWPILRGIISILASWGFIIFLSGFLRGESEGMGLPVFVVCTFALAAITPPPDVLAVLEGEGTGKVAQRRIPWPLFSHSVIIGMGLNWVCVFLAFSRRYAFFSAPVVFTTGFIMALYAAIGLLVACLAGGDWRKALIVFAVAPIVLGGTLLRLHLLPLW
jgi:hypothetical protein